MKELLTEWILNLTFFSLLTSMIIKILPGKSYIPYIRIFSGIMMILTLLQPVLNVTGLEDAIDMTLSQELYEMEMKQIENGLIRAEEEQMKRIEERYEEYLKEYGEEIIQQEGWRDEIEQEQYNEEGAGQEEWEESNELERKSE